MVSDYEGLTNATNGIIITEYEAYDVDRKLTSEWYIFKDQSTAQVIPYGGNYELMVRINGFRDYTVTEKKKISPRGGG